MTNKHTKSTQSRQVKGLPSRAGETKGEEEEDKEAAALSKIHGEGVAKGKERDEGEGKEGQVLDCGD